MSTKRFTVNPFDDLRLSVDDRTKLLAVAEELVHAKFAEYEEYINKRKWIDPVRWKKCSQAGAATTFMERKSVNPGSKMVAALMVGPLFGTLDDVMFGLVCPTLESMRIKASYLHDFSAAAVLATILEPTEDDPFRSVVVKWMEIDIPGASFGFVRNRDYVYLESTGILHLKNGERVGYHLLHSVSFAQTHERPGRIRGNMSLCGIFRQDGPDRTDCRGTSVIDPKGDIIPSMAMMRLVNATMAGVRYSYCGQMKKLAWLVEQRHAEASIFEIGGGMVLSALCLTCYALVGCSNPGIVRRIEVPPDNTYTYCDHCDSYRPEGALHCLKCRVCIEEYDHHCPWTGKCIGKGNVHFFYIWLLFLVLAFVYEVIEFTMYLLPSETQSIELSNDSLKIETPSITIS
ncbi:DHHC-type Zn-finger proteins [Plasmopara halstedii]|uniref:Palmitoyltransferase n=1 Tax=Plasmopara halstedii TaxID=4781 RepID=A0A0P1A5L0_PLAHL|nr:DHHC-type Zn-finger proteins [Plasmopara halstedii]CEG35612.1 DHHC-type Zn-finger proteins [Plasmopara halstedii]|eukprot:XP_024571981.1 DHHC-type Zn-finger proteins [Plasmopara halstedii]